MMRYLSSFFSITLLVGLASLLYFAHENPKPNPSFSGNVTWVSDGDTFKVAGHKWPVRVWGIDAPERDTPEGQTARDYLTKWIKGKPVTCETVVVDKYRRTVAKCFLGEIDIARRMLKIGQAKEFCSFTRGVYGYC
jgi:endonuclease YncB( thermonuclease family)